MLGLSTALSFLSGGGTPVSGGSVSVPDEPYVPPEPVDPPDPVDPDPGDTGGGDTGGGDTGGGDPTPPRHHLSCQCL